MRFPLLIKYFALATVAPFLFTVITGGIITIFDPPSREYDFYSDGYSLYWIVSCFASFVSTFSILPVLLNAIKAVASRKALSGVTWLFLPSLMFLAGILINFVIYDEENHVAFFIHFMAVCFAHGTFLIYAYKLFRKRLKKEKVDNTSFFSENTLDGSLSV